jgi:Polyketide synthase dehydratase
MGPDIVFPAAGYIAMAVEALYQTRQSINPVEGVDHPGQLSYRLRNVKFDKALVLEESDVRKTTLNLAPRLGTKDS